jgi:predicted dehydrogenase
VIDPNPDARKNALNNWGLKNVVEKPEDLSCRDTVEILILATPPEFRNDILKFFPNLKAVLVEKPLADTSIECVLFLDYCKSNNILVAVNLYRRSNPHLKKIISKVIPDFVGNYQVVSGVYGNGIKNNGVHFIDLAEMIFGDICSAKSILSETKFVEGPINSDFNCSFILTFSGDINVVVRPIIFNNYREIGLDILGENGRVLFINEFRMLVKIPRVVSKVLNNTYELDYESLEYEKINVEDAFYNVYSDLASALDMNARPVCDGERVLRLHRIIDDIINDR